MQLDPLPDATPQEPLKRGPGRPRKQRPASSEPASPVDTGPRVTDRFGAARIVGKSIFFIKGLEKRDPDWPKPFAIGGFCNNYLIADICKYLEEKAANAQASKRPATPGEMRRLENLLPGSKAARTNQSRTAKAKATETA
jgi:hypothetical protein